jgi:hypothetical protein
MRFLRNFMKFGSLNQFLDFSLNEKKTGKLITALGCTSPQGRYTHGLVAYAAE